MSDGTLVLQLNCLEHVVLVKASHHLSCRYMLWAQEADTAVSQEDMGGVHWGLHHYCGGLLVPGWLHVQVQVDDLPSHSTSPPHLWAPSCL